MMKRRCANKVKIIFLKKSGLRSAFFICQDCFFNFFLGKILGPMLIKEAITKVARNLKEETETIDDSELEGFPLDLTKDDIRLAMIAMSSVSDVLLDLE